MVFNSAVLLVLTVLSVPEAPMPTEFLVELEADSFFMVMDPGIYFMSLGEYADPRIRISLYDWWGSLEIYFEEILYDEIEGNPHLEAVYRLQMDSVTEWLEMDYIWALEFMDWIDTCTFRLKANWGEFDLLVHYTPGGQIGLERIEVE